MPDGEILDIREEDVEICLGFPRGGIKLSRINTSDNDHIFEWRSHIDIKKVTDHSIRPIDVYKVMMANKEDMNVQEFQRDFIVLMYTCIIEPHQSGAANQNLVLPLESMDNVSGYNWCGFVLKCLNDAKEKWEANRDAPFTGPLLFITVLYLDRVVNHQRRDVTPRMFPAFRGWTYDKIVKREDFELARGGFGKGQIDIKQSIPEEDTMKGAESDASGVDIKKDFVRSLGYDIRQLANIIVSIASKTNNMPFECRDCDAAKALAESAKAMLGNKSNFLSQQGDGVQNEVGKALSQSQVPPWSDDELNKVMDEFEEAMKKRANILKSGVIGGQIDPNNEFSSQAFDFDIEVGNGLDAGVLHNERSANSQNNAVMNENQVGNNSDVLVDPIGNVTGQGNRDVTALDAHKSKQGDDVVIQVCNELEKEPQIEHTKGERSKGKQLLNEDKKDNSPLAEHNLDSVVKQVCSELDNEQQIEPQKAKRSKGKHISKVSKESVHPLVSVRRSQRVAQKPCL